MGLNVNPKPTRNWIICSHKFSSFEIRLHRLCYLCWMCECVNVAMPLFLSHTHTQTQAHFFSFLLHLSSFITCVYTYVLCIVLSVSVNLKIFFLLAIKTKSYSSLITTSACVWLKMFSMLSFSFPCIYSHFAHFSFYWPLIYELRENARKFVNWERTAEIHIAKVAEKRMPAAAWDSSNFTWIKDKWNKCAIIDCRPFTFFFTFTQEKHSTFECNFLDFLWIILFPTRMYLYYEYERK